MKKIFQLFCLLACLLSTTFVFSEDKTVLLAILARNKAHVLGEYLKKIEELDYDKKLISVYINTNNNSDDTKEILLSWKKKYEDAYRNISFENVEVDFLQQSDPHLWTAERFSVLAKIRNRSLEKALEEKTDYYFVVDCDNFVAPNTLKKLIAYDKPIIAPLLKSIPEVGDMYSNYFCDIDQCGYFKNHSDYSRIYFGEVKGIFKVPVVHCTYLINSKYIDKLSYIDGSEDYEFVIFSKTARENDVEQYICNDCEYGTVLHFFDSPTLEEESARFQNYIAKTDVLKLLPLEAKDAEVVFTKHYAVGDDWGQNGEGMGFSGTGSLVSFAKPYMDFLQEFITNNEIKSVVDAGCGDWTFSQFMDWSGVDYTGFDVVKPVIERNKRKFETASTKFIHSNFIAEDLPSADLLVCKDVLQHCTVEDILTFIEQVKKFKHCLITNDIQPGNINIPIQRGLWRPIDLTKPPFNLKGAKIFTYRSQLVIKQVLYIQNL